MLKVVMRVLLLSTAFVACRHPELPLLSDAGGETVDAPGGCTGSASECGADNALYQCDETSGHLTKVQDCQHGCSVDHCKECEPNTTSCNGDDLVMCDSSGTIVNPMTCANGCQAQQCNTCKPGVSSCDGSGNAVTCGLDGKPGTPTACGAAGCINGVCNSCTPNSVTCQGDTLVTCGGNGMVQGTTACTFGCGTTPNGHCKVFAPSYGLSVPTGTLPDLVVDNMYAMNLNIQDCANSTAKIEFIENGAWTSTTLVSPQVSTVSQTGGPPICVVRFAKITVVSGSTLNIVSNGANDHVLSLQATGDVSIAGTVAFNNLYGGPAMGGDSLIYENVTPSIAPGAGGGGGVRAGGSGGTCSGCSAGGVGGAAITNIRTVLNRGSQGGTVKSPSGFFATSGGLAGGAIHLLSLTRVTVTSTGKLNLNGGGAIGRTNYNDRAGAGGSGGTLVVEAPNVTFSASAVAAANGGGGMGGCTVCVGDFIPTCTHANGENGQLGFARAAGGSCSNGAGSGGWEATGSTSPSANGLNGSAPNSSGGGGGSQGFIFLRGKTGANVMVTNGAIISPQPTIEAVTAN
jgi:hypothetical protein